MQLRKLLTDDDAVSPVIGVILMVAITVILAAVIASFVLGLGGEQEVAPSHTFTFDYDSSGELSITSQGGAPVRNDELFVRGDEGSSIGSGADIDVGDEWLQDEASGSIDDGVSAIVAGDTITVNVGSDYSVSVVWESLDSGQSAELASDEGPDA